MPVIPPPNFNERFVDKLMAPTRRVKAWIDAVTLYAQTIENIGSPEGVVTAKRAQKYMDTNRSGALYFKGQDGGNQGWYETDRVPENVKCVFTLDDLPDAVDNVIQLEDDTGYLFKQKVLDLGNNQIIQGSNTWMDGTHDGLTEIKGNTEGPLFQTNGTSGFKAFNLTLNQEGPGDLILLESTTTGSSFKLLDCEVIGGNIRLVSGLIFIANELLVDQDMQIIQDASGGVPTIIFSNIAVIFGLPINPFGVDGVVLFESGSSTASFRYIDSDTVMLNGGTAIKVEGGAAITEFLIQQAALQSFIGFGSTQVKVENPNDIITGTIENTSVTIVGADKFLVCEPIANETLPATGASSAAGITQAGDGDLIISDPTNSQTIRYTKLTNTNGVTTSQYAGIGNLAWLTGDLYSVDTINNEIKRHDGDGAVADTISAPASNPSGIVFIGEDLVSCDSVTNTLYFHDGYSETTANPIVLPFSPQGLAYDGVNLLIGELDTNNVFVQEGPTAITQYDFASAATILDDIWVTLDRSTDTVGFAVIDDSTIKFSLYDHPVTFDHSSVTMEITNVSGEVSSSDRGGAGFISDPEGGGIQIALVTGTWTDIKATGLFYSPFSQVEKMVLNDETNGEILWLGSRNRGRVITAQATFSRTTPASGDINYEISILVNDFVQKDSIVVGALPSATTIVSITTLPISRSLVKGDRVKMQIRRTSVATQDPQVIFAKVAIT